MPRNKRDEVFRHEPTVVQRRPITQRNMVSPVKTEDEAETFGFTGDSTIAPVKTEDEAETFGFTGDSTIAPVRRDRTPKGVNDGRGKRSMAEVMLSLPNDEHKALYAEERIASLEDQIQKVLDICTPGARAIIFRHRKSIKERFGADYE